jgi:hypothetical protein
VTLLEPGRAFAWRAKILTMQMVATHLVEATEAGSRNTLRLDLSGPAARVFGPLLKRRLLQVLQTENEGFRAEALRRVAAA